MLISVVTISFNQAQFLREAIDSVLSQDYGPIEYIVVDPGSTDGSREIIDSYGSRIKKIYEPDRGPADGLNKGFAVASGAIFCYLNSDDLLEPGAIAEMARRFKENPSVDIFYGDGFVVDESGTKLRKCFSDTFCLYAAAYGAAVVIQPSTFFRAEAFRSVGGFNVENRSNWDGELLIDMVLAGRTVRRVNSFLSQYRVHAAGITGSGRLEALHRQYRARMFEKIMRRSLNRWDTVAKFGWRAWKHASHPRALMERVLHGPIFARTK